MLEMSVLTLKVPWQVRVIVLRFIFHDNEPRSVCKYPVPFEHKGDEHPLQKVSACFYVKTRKLFFGKDMKLDREPKLDTCKSRRGKGRGQLRL